MDTFTLSNQNLLTIFTLNIRQNSLREVSKCIQVCFDSFTAFLALLKQDKQQIRIFPNRLTAQNRSIWIIFKPLHVLRHSLYSTCLTILTSNTHHSIADFVVITSRINKWNRKRHFSVLTALEKRLRSKLSLYSNAAFSGREKTVVKFGIVDGLKYSCIRQRKKELGAKYKFYFAPTFSLLSLIPEQMSRRIEFL